MQDYNNASELFVNPLAPSESAESLPQRSESEVGAAEATALPVGALVPQESADDLDESGNPIAIPEPPNPEEVMRKIAETNALEKCLKSLEDFPPYTPEAQNHDILIHGRWLERGGSAWWISTAGTGKSIASIQLALSWGARLPFAGITPHYALKTWIFQSEDSPSRITIDREDVCAELAEQYPNIDWRDIGKRQVMFVNSMGKVGVAFLEHLDGLLAAAQRTNNLPDYIIINPFLAFIGGPVSDGSYVTPFLRGGNIVNRPTCGLQHILERYNVGVLIFHHTNKPPTDNELKSWMASEFPEYQGAGSAEITNWGRSFVTMMRLVGNSDVVCISAGKNGNGLGWEKIGGSRRHYLAHSRGESIEGGGRHGWRELTEEERESIIGVERATAKNVAEEDAAKIAEHLRTRAMTPGDIEAFFTPIMGRLRTRIAKKVVMDQPARFHLSFRDALIGRTWFKFYGLIPNIETEIIQRKQKRIVEESKKSGKVALQDSAPVSAPDTDTTPPPAPSSAIPPEYSAIEQADDDAFSETVLPF